MSTDFYKLFGWLMLIIILAASNDLFDWQSRLVVNTTSSERTERNLNTISQRLTQLESITASLNKHVLRLVSKPEIQPRTNKVKVLLDNDSRLADIEEQIHQLYRLIESQANSNSMLSFNVANPGAYVEQVPQSEGPEISIDELFNAELIDNSWSMGAEVELNELFSTTDMQVAQLTNIDCRSTLCRANITQLKLPLAEEAYFESHLLIELTKIFKGGINLKRERGTNGQVNMVAYLVREGHQLPTLGF